MSTSRTALLAGALLLAGTQPLMAAGWQTRDVGGLDVELYVPDAEGARGVGQALMVGLHGCTQNNTALRDYAGFDAAAELFGMVVALPQVPDGGVIAGCWDYIGPDHTRENKYHGPVLAMVRELLSDLSLGIDPDQVYVVGLSSGGGEAFTLACLAPDVFAGVGLVAAPLVASEFLEGAFPPSSSADNYDACLGFAETASVAGAFDSQVMSIIHGNMDDVISLGNASLSLQLWKRIYGRNTTLTEAPLDISAVPGDATGVGVVVSDPTGPRITSMIIDGMGHFLPSGTDKGGEYVGEGGVAYVEYAMGYFSVNNRRAGGTAPELPKKGQPEDPPVDDPSSPGDMEDEGGCRCVHPSDSPLALFLILPVLLGLRRRTS